MALKKLNHTQINNQFIDEYIIQLSGNAVKIFLAISRKTIGWHKDTDRISNTQLMEMTGIKHRTTLTAAINELVECDLINVIRTGKGRNIMTFYEIKYEAENDLKEESTKKNGSKNDPINSDIRSKNDPISANIGSKNDPTKEIYINKDILNKEDDVAIDKQLQPATVDNKEAFNMIKKKFKEYNLQYYHDGKQARFIKMLIQRCNGDVEKVIDYLHKYVKLKIESKKEFWKSAPMTPQGLYARLDYVIEMDKQYMSKEDEATIEYLNKLFGGGNNG